MFINMDCSWARFVHVFHRGDEIQLCVWFDTEKQEAFSLNGIGNESKYNQHSADILFKIERGKNIPEPYFTELTTDKCFVGFID